MTPDQMQQAQTIAMVANLVVLVIAVVVIASMWKLFTKAGKPGWAILVPIYNIIVMLEIINRPLWWFVLMLIPFVNFIVSIIVAIDFAKAYGKDGGFAIGMILLPFVFYPMLAFGDNHYVGITR